MSLDFNAEDKSYLHSIEEAAAADKFYKFLSDRLIDLIEGARSMTEQEFLILQLRSEGKSFNNIALDMGIKRQNAHKSYQNALKKMQIGMTRDL